MATTTKKATAKKAAKKPAAKAKKPAAKKTTKKVTKKVTKKPSGAKRGTLRVVSAIMSLRKAASAEEIAEAMGISKGAVVQYLGSKDSQGDGTAVGEGYVEVQPAVGNPDAVDGERCLRYALTPAGRKVAEKAAKAAGSAKAASARPLSLMDAAIQVAQESKSPMRCKEIYDEIVKKGLWTPPAEGKTPMATLSAAIQRDTQAKEPRWEKADRGLFKLTTLGKKA